MNFLEKRMMELHKEIFNDALFVVANYDANFKGLLNKRRDQINIKIALHKKYNRRLKLLKL